jgi:hypothetical protein
MNGSRERGRDLLGRVIGSGSKNLRYEVASFISVEMP